MRFLGDEGIASTNNEADRALRGLVIFRKLCQGTRSEQGCRFVERGFSVIMTLQQHDEYLLEERLYRASRASIVASASATAPTSYRPASCSCSRSQRFSCFSIRGPGRCSGSPVSTLPGRTASSSSGRSGRSLAGATPGARGPASPTETRRSLGETNEPALLALLRATGAPVVFEAVVTIDPHQGFGR
ncbi:MAG: hypothetical protein HYV63_26985 [Candidatus Schekmanbacteria bacterium]|nr:hypothetical protein [Candidatus Schekmanbacteria bacterium]